MIEWIRFSITAVLLVLALISFASAVLGVYRFGFVMNRIHAAGIGDTLGLFLVVAAVSISSNSAFEILKLVLVVAFLWMTSPVNTHFLAQVEYYSNTRIGRYVSRAGENKDEEEKKK